MNRMACRLVCVATLVLTALSANTFAQPDNPRKLLIVVGAAGEPKYGEMFTAWATRWEQAAKTAGIDAQQISPEVAATDSREKLFAAFDQIATSPPNQFWLVLIGHGTFDGKQSKFNLAGPDVTDDELKNWLDKIDCQSATIVINCASASGGFLDKLSGANRIVITATKSGSEQNFAHFGDYLSQSIVDAAADLDKDGQTSLLEAFLSASKQTAEFYQADARLATEHALLDDNGDRKGTAADWFTGIRVVGRARDGSVPDGPRANQIFFLPGPQEAEWSAEARARRDELELKVEELIRQKPDLNEADYYKQLENLMVELARIYD